ncbi:MAG: serine aminopeptidase domain-containing protein [Phycisphaerae bacterium]
MNRDQPTDLACQLPLYRPLQPDIRSQSIQIPLSAGLTCPGYVLSRTDLTPFRCPGGSVLYLHGIQSHPGWFIGSAQAIARSGLTVVMLTRRGSGSSDLPRGHARSAGVLLADLDFAVDWLAGENQQGPCRGLGVSWGGKWLAAWAASRREVPLASLTLAAPGICARRGPSGWTKLRIAAALLTGRSRTRFAFGLDDPHLFTENPEMIDAMTADTLKLTDATARFLFASRQMDRALFKAPAGAIDLPVSLVLSAQDRIIDNDATRQELLRLVSGPERLTVHELPGQHTLEFEPDAQNYYRVLVESLPPQITRTLSG